MVRPRNLCFADDEDEPLPLFDARARARNTDPETSHESARRMTRTGAAASQEARCLRALIANPGVTRAELADLMGADPIMPARRLSGLREKGLVENGEARICRKGGTRAMTWRPTRAGEQMLEGGA